MCENESTPYSNYVKCNLILYLLLSGIFTDTDVNDNDSNLSSDDEFFLEEDLYTEVGDQ